ncbi:MAG: hypothetical protein Q7R95_09095 [bacterium]|nr:hypothetical protein [bacterium]
MIETSQSIDFQIDRTLGNIVRTVGFYAQVMRNGFDDPRSPLFKLNPFTINKAQARKRHPKMGKINFQQMMLDEGVSETTIERAGKNTGYDFKKIYKIAEYIERSSAGIGTSFVTGTYQDEKDGDLFLLVDGSDDPSSGKYYVGLDGLKSGKYYTWDEINARNQ